MSTTQSLFLSLFGRKSADKKSLSIYITVRISGLGVKRLSTGIAVPLSSFRDGRFVGRDSKSFNHEKNVRVLLDKLEQAYYRLVSNGIKPYPDTVINAFLEGSQEEKTIGQIMDLLVEHKEHAFKAGDASHHLPEKFRVLRNDVMGFVYVYFKKKDVPLRMINLDFINSLSMHLRAIPNSNVTVNKKIGNLNQGFLYAEKNNWIQNNPISEWKSLPEYKTNNEYLKTHEFELVLNFRLPNATHEVIKDSFIFMCLTGMGFSDMKKFSFSEIREIDGIHTIEYVRSKLKREGKIVRVPVLPIAMGLITKHYLKPFRSGKRGKTDKKPEDPVFAVPSGQTYNDKLKTLFEYNDLELDFAISSHMARKTFGNIITENLGIEAASQLLGHSSVSITEKAYVNNDSDSLLAMRSKLLIEKMDRNKEK
jgi:integrase/recombinase XerD